MTSEIPDQAEPGEPAASVLGSLPRDRPGTRSPRRPTSRGERAPGSSEADDQRSQSAKHSIEDLVWAGIAVAAEAATLGVKLANRMLEAGSERQGPPH